MKKVFFLLFVFCAHIVCAGPIESNLPERGPVLTTTAIVEVFHPEKGFVGIVLISREEEPFGVALPGGKVAYGESVEDAARRELLEKTNLPLKDLYLFQVNSDPKRDPRFHSVEVAYLAWTDQLPQARNGAAKTWVCPLENIPFDDLVFNHADILKQYMQGKQKSRIGNVNPVGSWFGF